MTGQPRVADLVLDPVLHDVRTVAGAAGLERVVEAVQWYTGDLGVMAGHLVICGAFHVNRRTGWIPWYAALRRPTRQRCSSSRGRCG